MTGQWEAYLHRIQRGTAQLAPFLKGIEDYVTEVVGKVAQAPAAPRSNGEATASAPGPNGASLLPQAAPGALRPNAPSLPPQSRLRAPPESQSATPARRRNCCAARSDSNRSAPTRKPSAAP